MVPAMGMGATADGVDTEVGEPVSLVEAGSARNMALATDVKSPKKTFLH
jgi:hypothetical protein